jgi:Holliday junction resolvase RusA-like endonuclease
MTLIPRAGNYHIVITLLMPPTTNNLFAGVGRRRVKSPAYVAWEKTAGWSLVTQKPRRIKGPVSVLIEVSERESANNWDLCNREKAAMDLLVTHGVIEGDHRPIVRDFAMRWADIDGIRITIVSLANTLAAVRDETGRAK